MAEAVAAFGVAAGVVQFIDFGARITNNFRSFYKAQLDNIDDTPNIEIIISDLQRVLEELQSSRGDGDQSGLAQLAKECQKAAEQLKDILQPMLIIKKRHEEDDKRQQEDEKRQKGDITAKGENNSHFGKPTKLFGKRTALKAAFKLAWKDDQILSLKNKIDQFRSQLTLHLLTSLRSLAHENTNHQNRILEAIDSLSQDAQNVRSIDRGFALPFLDYVTSKVNESARGYVKLQLQEELRAKIRDSYLDSANEFPFPLMAESRQNVLQKRILGSLYYDGMEDRGGRITEAYGSTFRWIFEDSPSDERKWINFKEWLQSDSQLYWITGKAGSGKSTLMKYVLEKDTASCDLSVGQISRSAQFLESWAGQDKLVIASFYFWNASISQQKTQAGLFRTLLYQLLENRPDLIPLVTPERWETLHFFNTEALDWSEEELGGMLKKTASEVTKTSRLCIFVDGLDEFDGQPNILIELLKELMTNAKIKLCVASRPWVEFEDAFRHSPSLMLQHLTYPDLKEYVSSHMAKSEGFQFLCRREPIFASQLKEDIIAKSSGVF